jgi:hypothetical protein
MIEILLKRSLSGACLGIAGLAALMWPVNGTPGLALVILFLIGGTVISVLAGFGGDLAVRRKVRR